MVAPLGAALSLPADAHRALRTLLSLLCEDPRAPTAVREPLRVAEDHLADSLVALGLPGVREADSVADLGSGAGVPGLVLAVALPAARVALVESVARKCAFIARAAEACGLANVEVVCRRIEDWPQGRERFALVTARALAPLPVVVEYAAPLLALGGSLLVWRGKRDPGEERSGARAAQQLGLRPEDPVAVLPYPAARHRHIQRFVKESPTPPGFPRRPGVASKRPLGGAGKRSGRPAAGKPAGPAGLPSSDRVRR